MKIIGIYPGTFDPITNGHLDIINRSRLFCEELIIAIGHNPNKSTLFPTNARIEFIRSTVDTYCANPESIHVLQFEGLLVDYAKSMGARLIIRGIRSVSDFEYEINLANVNKVLAPSVETIFLPTSPNLAVVSSSMVKEIAKHNGDISPFVPDCVVKPLFEKFGFVKYGE